MPGIFISYRRKDTIGHAGRLKKDLGERWGRSNVFMDVDSIPAGVRYEDPIDDALDSCHVSLVLIGENWLGGPESRINKEDDWVRREVAAALSRSDVKVVPILVEGASLPAASQLPEEIAPLLKIQVCRLSSSQWEYDLDQIHKVVESAARASALGGVLRRAREAVGGAGRWWKLGVPVAAIAAVAVVVLAGGGGPAEAGCANQAIPPDVRDELSSAADTTRPAVEGSVYYGTCDGQGWALARFPDGSDGVFKQTGFDWSRLGSIGSARCSIPDELLALWRQPAC